LVISSQQEMYLGDSELLSVGISPGVSPSLVFRGISVGGGRMDNSEGKAGAGVIKGVARSS
jgi:hypothetical protein